LIKEKKLLDILSGKKGEIRLHHSLATGIQYHVSSFTEFSGAVMRVPSKVSEGVIWARRLLTETGRRNTTKTQVMLQRYLEQDPGVAERISLRVTAKETIVFCDLGYGHVGHVVRSLPQRQRRDGSGDELMQELERILRESQEH
jgi:hypothetical protein